MVNAEGAQESPGYRSGQLIEMFTPPNNTPGVCVDSTPIQLVGDHVITRAPF